MVSLRALWRSWFQGFYHQVEHHSDSDVLVAYEDAKAKFGEDSPEARALEPHVRAIHRRREEPDDQTVTTHDNPA
jgi:hypothetical protein